MKSFCVYIHTFPNNKVYIGITSQNTKSRWQNGNGYKGNIRLTRAINKYGWENIKHEILFYGLTEEQAKQKEISLIKEYNSTNSLYGYNVSYGGNVPSLETREKISKSHIGIVPNDKARQKMRLAKLGVKQSQETIQKRIKVGKDNPMFGRVVGNKEREHLRALFKGKPAHINTIKANQVNIVQYDKSGNLIAEFESIKQASVNLNIPYQRICHNCNGHQKYCNGYIFRHKEKDSEKF